MSGWERPDPPASEPAQPSSDAPPTSYWARSRDANGLGPGSLIRSGWRLYRSASRQFLLAAAIPGLIGVLLSLPSLVFGAAVMQAMFDALADFLVRVAADPQAYRYADSQAFQAELQARIQVAIAPQADLAAYSALGGGVAIAVGLIGTSVLTAAALAATAGQPISVGRAFRLVAARGGLLKPIAAIAIGWAAFSLVALSLQTATGFQAWAGAPGSARSVLIGSLAAVTSLVVAIGAVVLAVRWVLYIPTILVEGLGIGPGIGRATQLARGIQMRLALAITGVLILEAVSVGIVAAIIAFAVGISAGSVLVGFATYVGVTFIGNLLWAPLLPAMLALAYRTMTAAVAPTRPRVDG